jgi:hypothetical protein
MDLQPLLLTLVVSMAPKERKQATVSGSLLSKFNLSICLLINHTAAARRRR